MTFTTADQRLPSMPQTDVARPSQKVDSPAQLRQQRLDSLDTYRGLIMITLAFAGLGLAETAENMLNRGGQQPVWRHVHYQFSHVEWTGCGYWDLIQPSFMFMVGVSMAFSYVRRQARGDSYARMFGHAAWRSAVLILLGIFLISNWDESTNWSLMNVLTQIGLGYLFLFLLWNRPVGVQATVATVILIGTWLLYVTYPHSGIDISQGAPEVGVSAEWAREHLQGIDPAWHKNANVGHAIDVWLLNRLPHNEPFRFNNGGYQTLNFLPSLATMLFGLMCGQLLRAQYPERRKLAVLIIAGLAGLLVGQMLHTLGICPLVKRIWTPSWALYSTGWCCLILALLYGIVDVLGLRRWTFPLVVVGMNSIAIYVMSMLLKPWTARTLKTHFGPEVFQFELRWQGSSYRLLPHMDSSLLEALQPTVQAVLVGLCFWLACLWMYRRRIFVRI